MTLKSRYKKFLKLSRLASVTIREFGFSYFINAAYLQLKREKLAIFSPDPDFPRKEQPYSQVKAYHEWLRIHQIHAFEEKEFEEELSKFSKLPTIAVILQVTERNKDQLKESLKSIISQPYRNLKVYLHSSDEDIRDASELMSSTKSSISHQILITSNDLNQLCMSINEDYMMFMTSGDLLTKNALYLIIKSLNSTNENYDIIYSDEDQLSENRRINPFFKPDWSPDLFLSYDYISNFYLVNSKIFIQSGGFNDKLLETNHYDLLLRLTEITDKICHIPTVLISCEKRIRSATIYEKEVLEVLSRTLKRRNLEGIPKKGKIENTFKIDLTLKNEPKVSIIIPTKDNFDLLQRCIKTLKIKTSYKNYEIIIIDNNSSNKETLSYLTSLPHNIIRYQHPFNFSKMNNLVASKLSTDYLLFLNDDTAILEPEWLTEMVKICQQKGIGIVGAKLVFSNNMIQHAGMVILPSGAGFHPLQGVNGNNPGYFGSLNTVRNCSSVTGACLLIKKEVFDMIGGFDNNFDLYYGDTDLCLKTIERGYRVVYTPYARILHEGSSKIKEHSTRFYTVENHYHFVKKWPMVKKGDPFYNPNLTWDYKIDIS
ncbi:hypothetical protein NSIN_10195 [Nitrosotalea sinensis]|uniref:Glycosyltransferase 2-like domain-containing protein n=1 Tax=Nitrosotalea sinensis TaxID=1499975 RepID=A0A2H1EEP8_9ARCH|nr:glycosyltransferase family 2 protein [Candidatus Nitrosotalea sinensis]SHO42836.1 hypothetical protein NSIN_10195 [Candidatus Nitrosotalea sinensis]